jgi:phosphatidylglycerophosphate synthase
MSLLRPSFARGRDRGAFAPDAIGPTPTEPSWKERFDDPLNRVYRYPLARLIVRRLVRTPVTPNQVTAVQPLLAALSGYLVALGDHRRLVLAALIFEVRSVLDCVDGTLARAKKMTSESGHAIDAIADWLGTLLLYAGVLWRFHRAPPAPGAWSHVLSVDGVIAIVLLQAALRSFASDYYRAKLVSVFETGRDDTVESLRRKVRALGAGAPIFARIEVAIGRAGHRCFAGERFDPDAADRSVAYLRARARRPLARAVASAWGLTNGDAFLSIVMSSMLADRLWEAQVFFATAGVAWVFAVIALSAKLVRR